MTLQAAREEAVDEMATSIMQAMLVALQRHGDDPWNSDIVCAALLEVIVCRLGTVHKEIPRLIYEILDEELKGEEWS